MKVGITGATGLIGRALCVRLLADGAEVTAFTRDAAFAQQRLPAGTRAVEWNPVAGVAPAGALDGLDALVNLAGETIAPGIWTAERRRRIRDSRVLGTRNLVDSIRTLGRRPGVLVSGSAVGYYGDRGDEVLAEESASGGDFLARVCAAWEAEAQKAAELGVRVARVRAGVVLSRRGGLLGTMAVPFRFGLGGRLGNGRQWISWVHVEDEVGLLIHAIHQPQIEGALHATSPEPVTNNTLTSALGVALRRPALLWVPALAVRLAFGESAHMVLDSQRAQPARALATGYRFRFPDLRGALADVLPAR